ncbi:MAG: hypothetical protein ACK4QW_03375 [Alphaproteobacteria bacterium]
MRARFESSRILWLARLFSAGLLAVGAPAAATGQAVTAETAPASGPSADPPPRTAFAPDSAATFPAIRGSVDFTVQNDGLYRAPGYGARNVLFTDTLASIGVYASQA